MRFIAPQKSNFEIVSARAFARPCPSCTEQCTCTHVEELARGRQHGSAHVAAAVLQSGRRDGVHSAPETACSECTDSES